MRLLPGVHELIGEVFDYIETFYNARRRHSTLGYLSPAQIETSTLSQDGEKDAASRLPIARSARTITT